MEIPATPRPYKGHQDYCLWFSQGSCKKCVERCPVEALSEKGHDKILCSRHVHETCKAYIVEHFGFEGYACGLCQTGVPCESKIPVKSDLN
jgi:epoxyqueuosine reductase QueG